MKLSAPLIHLLYCCFFLLFFSTACAQQVTQVDQSLEPLSELEIMVKVHEETQNEYLYFIEKQKEIRSKLDKHIETMDQEKVELLRSTYDAIVLKDREKVKAIAQYVPPENVEVATKSWLNLNDKFMNRIHCVSEVVMPMIMPNEKLRNITVYLSDKYHLEIAKTKEEVGAEYRKLKEKQGVVYAKYKGVDYKRPVPLDDKSKRKKTGKEKTEKEKIKKNIYADAWILIIDSK